MNTTEEPPLPPRPRAARALRGALWFVGAVLLLAAVSWLAVPPLLKWQAQKQLSELLGRSVQIGDVEFAPWALALTVHDIAVAAPPGSDNSEPQLRIKRLHVDAEASSLFRLAPVVSALEIDEPQLRVARLADGRLDIDDLRARLASRPAAKPSEPARFALYNLQMRGGRLTLDDRPVARHHELAALNITLPFLSNLPAHVLVKVQPRLAFTLNGTAFDSGAQATPFARDQRAELKLKMADLDLAPWVPYLPPWLPLRVQQGFVSAELQVDFAVDASATPHVALRGQVAARDLALADAQAAPVLSWRRLAIGLADVQPLMRKVVLGKVELDGARLNVARDAGGAINLLRLATAAPAQAASASTPAAPPTASPAWQASVQSVVLTNAGVHWQDAAVQPAAAVDIEGLGVVAGPVAHPLVAAVPLKLEGRLASGGDAKAKPAEFSAEGTASPSAAAVAVDVRELDLAMLAPYLAERLVPRVNGRAALQARLDWAAGDAPRMKLALAKAQIDDLRVQEAGVRAMPASLQTITVSDSSIDLVSLQAELGSIKLDKPALQVTRRADGTWNLLSWLRAASPAPVTAAPAAGPQWRVRLRELLLENGQLRWRDERPQEQPQQRPAAEPVLLMADGMRLSVQGLAWPSGPPARVQFGTRLSQGDKPLAAASAARIEWKGQAALEPLLARGELLVERFPLHAFEPYAGTGLNLELQHAEAHWRGEVAVQQAKAGLSVSAKGDAQLAGVRVNAKAGDGTVGDELMNWNSFTLRGVQATLAPPAKPRIEVAEMVLADFYSRLVITEQGRFNLQDVAGAPVAADSPAASAAEPAASAPAPAAGTPLPVDIAINSTRIVNGKVDFTDRFVRPNYSAELTELNGSVGAFRSDTRDMATLELRGRAARTAALEITGSLNPTAKPLALDIRAKATDLELAPLSPYAGRYAGYAIERGKLSMDVAYKIEPDGKLTAQNQVILNQLTFGEKVDSPDATKLPVQLALALLKDRNGVIDINLPISGSINDPQFSIFGIVLKIIGNLLVKAITAPFSLLAGGGSDDLSTVAFVPGTARLAPGAEAAIDKVAKALTDRPALKMTVSGSSDPAGERDAMQAAALEARLQAEQRRDRLRADAAADAASAPLPPLAAEQRAALIKRLYADTKLPDKPRNLVGLAKDIPVAEMEARLKAAVPVNADTARELALQRGLAVRDALVAQGLPSERLFLAAPRLHAAGDAAQKPDARWEPSVQLTLSTN